SGIDIALLEQLGILHGINIKITYAGGISSFEDIQTIEKLGKGKIDFTIGSALDIFGGRLKYSEVVKYTT
ncbi:MAG TPA: phosphoribosylformimino-5-aminoimidazole carboxamide ribotide isomerase, partial [Clostridia bacterium]|nr:phosphoribosylformimino-5-aminoimidazole carboxamide ribotide isomerase [Clostridia bacterium]